MEKKIIVILINDEKKLILQENIDLMCNRIHRAK
jgi:hypothetical protein